MVKLWLLIIGFIYFSYAQEYFCVYVNNIKKEDLEKFKNIYFEKSGNLYKIGFTDNIALLKKIKNFLEKNYQNVYLGYCKPNLNKIHKIANRRTSEIKNYKKLNTKINFSKVNILNFYKDNLSNLKELFNQLVNPKGYTLNLSNNDDLYINYLKTKNKIETLLLKTSTSNFNFIFGMDYNSSQIVADDRYPFIFRLYTGLKIPLLKGGILDKKYNGEFSKKINFIRKNTPIYPIKTVSYITFSIFTITRQNQYVINKKLISFLKKLSKYIRGVAKYDKYYISLLNNIKLIEKQIPKNYFFSKNLKSYNFCILDEYTIQQILEKKERKLLNLLKNTEIMEKNYMLLNSKADIQVRYNYRDSFEKNLNNDYFSLALNLDVPFSTSNENFKKLEKLKLLDKEKKALYEFYKIKTNVHNELLSQLQNYYLYKNHLIEFEIIVNKIEKRISLVELGIDELNLELITNLFRRAYNQLNLINLYKQKLLLSYLKLQEILKRLDSKEKITCKME